MADVVTKETGGDADERTLYELSYLIIPSLNEEGMLGVVEDTKAVISKQDGVIMSEGRPKKVALAYDMSKRIANKRQVFSSAYFGWLRFRLPYARVRALEEALGAKDAVIRYLIVKTAREAPLPRRRPRKKVVPPPRRVVQEEKAPVDEERLDKELEELLTT